MDAFLCVIFHLFRQRSTDIYNKNKTHVHRTHRHKRTRTDRMQLNYLTAFTVHVTATNQLTFPEIHTKNSNRDLPVQNSSLYFFVRKIRVVRICMQQCTLHTARPNQTTKIEFFLFGKCIVALMVIAPVCIRFKENNRIP